MGDVRLGCPLIRHDQVASTMDEALALARTGASQGTTVVADFQHAGRGRADRHWVAPHGTALLMSLLLRPERAVANLSPLSLLSALAVVETIADLYHLDATVKWPNDVQIAGRKLCGILLRTHMLPGERWPVVVLGIGLNANIPALSLPDAATSLLIERGEAVDRDVLRESLVSHLERRYRQFLTGDIGDAWRQLTAMLAYRGQRVTVQDGARQLHGTIDGIAPSGALLLRTKADEVVEVTSGDLTRGPRPVE